MDEDGLERLLLHLLHTGEDHARDPEEDDIVACDHDGRGIPVVEVCCVLIGPAHRGERPERGREPGVEHVLFARQVLAAALFALGGVFALDVDVAALVAVPRGDLVTPPQLAGNTPVMHVFHPVDIGLGEALRHELDRAVVHDANGFLNSARAEADLAVFVAHDGNFAVHNGQDAGLADQVLELLVLRVDRNACIAHHRLRTGGGDDDIAAAVGERVADIPEVARLVDILDLRVGERRQAVRAPVDDAAALVDQALIVELAERLAHGLGAALVHREAGAGPVTARAHLLLLLDDAVAVLFLPLPHAL